MVVAEAEPFKRNSWKLRPMYCAASQVTTPPPISTSPNPSSELQGLILPRSAYRVYPLQWISTVETPHGVVCQQKPITLRRSLGLICLDVPSSTSQTKTKETEGNAFRMSNQLL
jgi:hypothetical protein